jgi:hypothetical protein
VLSARSPRSAGERRTTVSVDALERRLGVGEEGAVVHDELVAAPAEHVRRVAPLDARRAELDGDRLEDVLAPREHRVVAAAGGQRDGEEGGRQQRGAAWGRAHGRERGERTEGSEGGTRERGGSAFVTAGRILRHCLHVYRK